MNDWGNLLYKKSLKYFKFYVFLQIIAWIIICIIPIGMIGVWVKYGYIHWLIFGVIIGIEIIVAFIFLIFSYQLSIFEIYENGIINPFPHKLKHKKEQGYISFDEILNIHSNEKGYLIFDTVKGQRKIGLECRGQELQHILGIARKAKRKYDDKKRQST